MKRRKALVMGTGLDVEHAIALSSIFDTYYFVPYFTAFPQFKDYCYGIGMEGINKVDYFWEHVDSSDLICTFDVGFGDMIEYLREKGKVCFGAGRGERLELDRWWLKKIMKKVGMPVVDSVKVKGISRLREYLKNNNDVIVKLSIFRGDCETFPSHSYDNVEPYLDYIETKFGAYKDEYEFIVEKKVDAIVETGIDGLFSPTQGFLTPIMWGIEGNGAYMGRVDNELPMWFRRSSVKLEPIMRKLNYRGFISTENRIVSDKKDYLIDMTCRIPHPLGHIHTLAIDNYPEVIWGVANNRKVTPKIKKKYWGCLPVSSEEQQNVDIELRFPEELRKYIKFSYGFKVNGKYYSAHQGTVVACIVYGGNNMEEVKDKILKIKEQLIGLRLESDDKGLDNAIEGLKIMENMEGL